MSMLPHVALYIVVTGGLLTAAAQAQDLPAEAQVRFKPVAASKLGTDWRTGTLYSSAGDCARILTADPTVRRGRRVLQLLAVEKLQRKEGFTWIDVPVQKLRGKEPRWCGEAVGG